jgi:hypothetical protein
MAATMSCSLRATGQLALRTSIFRGEPGTVTIPARPAHHWDVPAASIPTPE